MKISRDAKIKWYASILKTRMNLWIILVLLICGCTSKDTMNRHSNDILLKIDNGFFTENGNAVRVAVAPLTMAIPSNVPDFMVQACVRAAKTLNTADGKTLIQIAYPASIQNVSSAAFFISWNTIQSNDPNEQASTALSIMGQYIVGAEISFDSNRYNYAVDPNDAQVDAESICLHEFGHALGFAHSVSTDSFMYPHLFNGQVRRRLSEVDRKNLKRVY